MLPLFFQVVLLDSPAKAGARLIIPSLATPVGGLISGIVMSQYGHLATLVRTGATLMAIGNGLIVALRFTDASWKYFLFIFPANLGQGIVYPSILFTVLAAFGHEGELFAPCISRSSLKYLRPRRFGLHRVSHPVNGLGLGCLYHFSNRPEHALGTSS